jgi:F-type H+-transporting ATPase subunit gamma
MRMTALRNKVINSKRFVDEATEILRELNLYKEITYKKEYDSANKRAFKKHTETALPEKSTAVIIVSSNQGLCGKYNAEIFKQLENHILEENAAAEIFIVGKKGQEHYLTNKKYNFKFYPYNLTDDFNYSDLLRLVMMFPYYKRILMVYSRFVNTIKRDVVETLLVAPPTGDIAAHAEEKISFVFEPSVDELIRDISAKLRAAAFQQQILDSRLSQFSAQMVGMQTASENSKVLLGELSHEYNKQRRKLIDKKISEVLGGSALW